MDEIKAAGAAERLLTKPGGESAQMMEIDDAEGA
jgi:hypothetical protein